MKRDKPRCTCRGPQTGRVCGSPYQVQIDPIRPRALGGDDTSANLRVLCRAHNLYEAERALGLKLMARYRAQP